MKKQTPGDILVAFILVSLFVSTVSAQRKIEADTALLSPARVDAIYLLKETAQKLQTETDTLGAGRLQARIADKLWPVEQKFALQVFRWAFENVRKPAAADLPKSDHVNYLNRQAQTAKDVLRQLGARDNVTADAWLKELETTKEDKNSPSAFSDQSRLELLSQLALEFAPTNPDKASRLGLAALSGNEVPSGFPRLLFALAIFDRQVSDQLFRASIATLRRGGFVATTPLIALNNYLFAPGGQLSSVAKAADAQLLANYYIDAAWQQPQGTPATGATASLYSLLETRGSSIVSVYAPERLPELRGQMTRIAATLTNEQAQLTDLLRATQQQQSTISTRNNYDIDDQITRAEKERNPQVRDALLNSIVHALMRQDIDKAKAICSKIGDEKLRSVTEDDLNLIRLQQLFFRREYEEARKVATLFNNTTLRAKVLIHLAAKSYSESKNPAEPEELLTEAVNILVKAPDNCHKTQVLLNVVEQYARFNSVRAFETLASAISCLNRMKSETTPQSVITRSQPLRIKTYTVINGAEMTAENEASPDSIDFVQIDALAAHDYLQLKLQASAIQQPIQRANFLIAVAGSVLRDHKGMPTASAVR